MVGKDNRIIKLSIVFLVIVSMTVVFVIRMFNVTYDYRIFHKFNVSLNEYLEDQNFSGEVLMAKDGEIYYSKAIGNYIRSEEVKELTTDTSLPIASLSKTVTGAAILRLEAEGKLGLDDTLSKYYPKNNEFSSVSIRNLLEMKSGIPDVVTESLTSDEVIDVDTMITRILAQKPECEPGRKYSYSNSDYFILGNIIEMLSQKTYYDYVCEEFFKPLGMYNMGKLNQTQLGEFGKSKEHQEYVYENTYSAGGLSASVVDLYKWQRALYSGEMDFDITKAFYDAEYSCGLSKNVNVYYHKGELKYCTSYMQYDTDNDEQIIVLCNNDESDAQEIANAAMHMFHEYLKEVK